MNDYFVTENYIDTDKKIKWYFRNKTIWEKIKEFFGFGETIDKYWSKIK